jgi:hypothetical protein
MIKTIKKIILSSLSILGISFLFWILFLLNPNWLYANKTQFDIVTVYHNQNLDEQTETVINNAIILISNSELFDDEISIELCLNDDKIYPNLNPLIGQPLAYAMLNKTVLKNCKIKFNENIAETQWEINNYEHRKFNLTWLLAHEFTHNLQYNANSNYVIKSTLGKINWKLEGHAEYVSREFMHDGELKNKIETYLIEEQKEHIGFPVFELEDGTEQILAYFKYALVIQYLMEEKELSFNQICDLERGLDKLYYEMIDWSKK